MKEEEEVLFIVFGATLNGGYQSRKIIKEYGFDIINKCNYVLDDSKINLFNYSSKDKLPIYEKWFNDKIYVDEKEIELLDFKYELDGVRVGFDKKQIIDSVCGKRDSVLTVGASNIDLIVQLKKAYGSYITSIYFFEDYNTVQNTYDFISDNNEKKVRINANKKCKIFI